MPHGRRTSHRPRSRRRLLVAASLGLILVGATAIGLDSHGVGWALVLGGVALVVTAVQS
jgi:hypothetical protein